MTGRMRVTGARVVAIGSLACVTLGAGLAAAAVSGWSPARGSGAAGTVLWMRHYDGPGHYKDFPAALAISPGGRTVFVTGRSAGANRTADYATIAYSTRTGATRWVSRYSGPASGQDAATGIAVSPDGRAVFVTGKSQQRTSWAFVTMAYDAATGTRMWVSKYPGYNPAGIAASPDGRTVYVTAPGLDAGPGHAGIYVTVAYDAATGRALWVSRSAPLGGGPSALAVSPDGRAVYVTGEEQTSPLGIGPLGMVTIAYGAANGKQLWISSLPATKKPGLAQLPSSVTVSPDGREVLVTGTLAGRASPSFGTIAYAARTGARLWARRNVPGAAVSLAVSARSPDRGMVFVTGSAGSPSGRAATLTAAYNPATGRELWASRYSGPGASSGGRTVAVSPDGRTVYVTSRTVSDKGWIDYATIAYRAATGARLWIGQRRVADAPGYDFPGGPWIDDPQGQLAVSSAGGTVVIIGFTTRTRLNPDYLTIAYRA